MDEGGKLAEQLQKIRAEVQREGSATISREELRILCPDWLPVSDQFMQIANIAQEERWSFAFLPNGSVRFDSYSS